MSTDFELTDSPFPASGTAYGTGGARKSTAGGASASGAGSSSAAASASSASSSSWFTPVFAHATERTSLLRSTSLKSPTTRRWPVHETLPLLRVNSADGWPRTSSFADLQDLLPPPQPTVWDFFLAGSVRASVCNMSSAVLGTGALALPYAFSQCGVVVGLALLVVFALLAVYSINLLLACRRLSELESLEEMAEYCFGRWMALAVEWLIILFCVGTCASEIVALGDVAMPALKPWLTADSVWLSRPVVVSVITALTMFPLSLVSNISSLRFASLFSVVAVVFLAITVCIRALPALATRSWADLLWPGEAWGVLESMPIFVFAFTCQVNVFSIYSELKRPTVERIDSVTNYSVALSALVYVAIGLLGYLHYAQQTAPDILQNFDDFDPLMLCTQLAVAVFLVMGFPLSLLPARFTCELMTGQRGQESPLRVVAYTAVLVLLSLLLALSIPNLDELFAILGSTLSAIICFILPAALYLRVLDEGPSTQGHSTGSWAATRLPAWLLLGAGVVLGVVTTAVSVFDFAHQLTARAPAVGPAAK